MSCGCRDGGALAGGPRLGREAGVPCCHRDGRQLQAPQQLREAGQAAGGDEDFLRLALH